VRIPVREGFLSNCPRHLMLFMEWADIEHRACGSPEIPVEELKV